VSSKEKLVSSLTHWLAEAVDTRTQLLIPIPYNPQILHKLRKSQADIQKTLQKAKKYQELLERGLVSSRAELARKEGVSRARITQILYFLRLHPEIREYLTSLTDQNLVRHFGVEKVRKIARMEREGQQARFMELKEKVERILNNRPHWKQ
jgi:hypothetical protein